MNILNLVETLTIVTSVVTILLIIINQPDTSDTFGAKTSFLHTKRGFEKQIYQFTIVSAVVLFVLVLIAQILK